MFSLLILLLLSRAYASTPFSDLVVHESIPRIPNGFMLLSSAPANQTLNLRIALANANMTGLEDMLYAVSTPTSPLYGQHLSKEEVWTGSTDALPCTDLIQVEGYVRPTNETMSIINEFLQMNNIGAKKISPAGDWLAFNITVIQANTLFGANYSVFQHEATGNQITRTLSYSIPAALQGHLELIHPSISFDISVNQSLTNMTLPLTSSQNGPSSRLGSRQSLPNFCIVNEVTPACLQGLYGIPTTLATQSTKLVFSV